jgi:hypothetical protein
LENRALAAIAAICCVVGIGLVRDQIAKERSGR